eukprot:800016_1
MQITAAPAILMIFLLSIKVKSLFQDQNKLKETSTQKAQRIKRYHFMEPKKDYYDEYHHQIYKKRIKHQGFVKREVKHDSNERNTGIVTKRTRTPPCDAIDNT